MTRLALGGKCGRPGRPVSSAFGQQRSQGGEPMPDAGLLEEMAARRVYGVQSRGSIAYSLVIVSSRFRIMLATVVQAASSVVSSLGFTGDSPILEQRRGLVFVPRIVEQFRCSACRAARPTSCGSGLTRGGQAESVGDALIRRRAALRHHALRQRARRLDDRSDRSTAPAPAAACWSRCGAPCTSRDRAHRR